MRKKALVLVAHPDDETIWMGGMILNSKDIDWTIFSLCRADDPDRAPKFKKVCEHYGARGIISDLEDDGIMTVDESLQEIKKRIVEKISGEKFAYIFTHGYNGEYGHERHLGVHLAVKELLKNKVLACEKLFFFSYEAEQNIISNSRFANFAFQLDNQALMAKRNIIEKMYGFAENSFESISCLTKETFTQS